MPQHIDPSIIIDATLYTLLAFSVITWVIILYKVWQFSKTKQYNDQYNEAFWNANNISTAQILLMKSNMVQKQKLLKLVLNG